MRHSDSEPAKVPIACGGSVAFAEVSLWTPEVRSRGEHPCRAPASDVVIKGVADYEDALRVGISQSFERCRKHRRTRFTDKRHGAAEPLIEGCQRTRRRDQSLCACLRQISAL